MRVVVSVVAAFACAAVLLAAQVISDRKIPKAWEASELATMDVPLAGLRAAPIHQDPDDYYKRPVYGAGVVLGAPASLQLPKAYAVYYPGKEPAGYMEWLRQQEPAAITLDLASIKTDQDWIRAGELLFHGARRVNEITLDDTRNPAWYAATGVKAATDGTVPAYRYFVRKKGDVVVSAARCALCHTRVLSDGSVVVGAQGNNPTTFLQGFYFKRAVNNAGAPAAQDPRESSFRDFSVPWLSPNPADLLRRMTVAELAAAYMAVPAGVVARPDTSLFYPPKTPDLIGVKDRAYLDATGLIQHRSIADLMRYISLVELSNQWDRFGEHGSVYGMTDNTMLPRFSDEQLYAMALYVYSLKPPPNPNKPDSTTRRGEQIFQREGCTTCHTPPLYTNNKLTPAEGFEIPGDHLNKYSILPTSVGTDPRLALQTRKGTGYYRPPSLKGVWYRGPFEHNGSVATLEDWFDPHRLDDDYVPTGFKGVNATRRPVKGHQFGLNLPVDEKKALIAFLKTL